MSRVSYFQRFSQRENHATNNTLLIFRHFYQSSPLKLQSVLVALVEEDMSIGLSFEQQVHETESVPDALISQEPFRIFIETKRGGTLDADQIRRHINSIADRAQINECNILLGLTREPILPTQAQELRQSALARRIRFATVTFSQVAGELRRQCADYESDLLAMVDDYEQYLAEERLLESYNQRMVVFPCGDSFSDNERYGLYYEPTSRPCKSNNQFLGIYTQKRVGLVGKIEAISSCAYQAGEIVEQTAEFGVLTAEHKKRIQEAIESISYHDLKTQAHRFYLVDKFAETVLSKQSFGGMRSHQYLDLVAITQGIFDPHKSYVAGEIAEMVRGKTFE